MTFNAFTGGWVKDGLNYYYYNKEGLYNDPSSKGKVYIDPEHTLPEDTNLSIDEIPGGSECYFNYKGELMYSYTGPLLNTYYPTAIETDSPSEYKGPTGDNKRYFVQNGVIVTTEGLVKDSEENVYCIDNQHHLRTNCTLYLDSELLNDLEINDSLLKANYYRFGADGLMINTAGEPVHINMSNGKINDSLNEEPLTNCHGLFMINGLNGNTHLICIKEDGTAVINETFYVSSEMLNGYFVDGNAVEEGLYYFDSNGHMYYGNELLNDNHEFEEIVSGISQGGGN